MIEDHAERIERLQRALAEEYMARGDVFNVPGRSLIFKVDPHYCLGLFPGVVEFLARHAGMFPHKVRESLVRTGNLVVHPETGAPSLPLHLLWDQGQIVKRVRIECCFLHGGFVDRALLLFARQEGELAVSPLSVDAQERDKVNAFLEGKTPLAGLAYREVAEQ